MFALIAQVLRVRAYFSQLFGTNFLFSPPASHFQVLFVSYCSSMFLTSTATPKSVRKIGATRHLLSLPTDEHIGSLKKQCASATLHALGPCERVLASEDNTRWSGKHRSPRRRVEHKFEVTWLVVIPHQLY